MNRTTTQERYRFDEDGHKHEILVDGEWKPLIGVTTALGVIAKPALIQWSADEAVKRLGWVNEKYEDKAPALEMIATLLPTLTVDSYFQLLTEARTAHAKRKEKAGDWGTEVHALIETWIKACIEKNEGYPDMAISPSDERVLKFVGWAVENKVKFLQSEKHVYSEKLWIGGILDMVIEMDGKRLIADVKTSSGIYDEAFFQMGAYDLCLEEMGEKIDGYLVINIKKDGKFDLKMALDRDLNKQAFQHALGLYKVLQSLKKK